MVNSMSTNINSIKQKILSLVSIARKKNRPATSCSFNKIEVFTKLRITNQESFVAERKSSAGSALFFSYYHLSYQYEV